MRLDLASVNVGDLHGETRAIYLELCRRQGGEIGRIAEDLIAADLRWQQHPLARFRAWAPHCRACPGVEMVIAGVDHRCPRCGAIEERTSQRAALHSLRPGVDTLVVRGGNRCLAGETLIYDPVEDVHRRIDSITEPLHVLAWDGEEEVVALAFPTARKGPDPLYRVELSDGSAFTATGDHRLLTALDEWVPVSALGVGSLLLGGARVERVTFDRHDHHYDLIVPGPNCFKVGPAFHHNSGKTRLGAAICVAMALGRNDPAVKEWARINRADLSRIQEGPGRVWAVSLTWDTAMEFMRPALDGYLPPGCVGKNWTQKGQATITLPNGGVIVNKVVEQGRDAFQGAKIHGLWWDEEPRDDGVVKEGRLRLADHHGLEVFTLTPLSGWTPLMRSLIGWQERGEAPPADEAHPKPLDGEDNPHVPASYLRKLIGTGFDAASRKRGDITEAEGRVHPSFRRDVHVVRAFPIPAEWRRFAAIDFGVRDPFVHAWGALAPDDVLHVYRERYQPERTTADHALAIHEAELCPTCWPGGENPVKPGTPDWWAWIIEGNQGQARVKGAATICHDCKGTARREVIEGRWADPEDTNSIATLHREYDIRCWSAVKARRAGYDAIERRLALDAERRPHIVFHDCCPNTIREFAGLQWAPQTSADEMKVKGDDHAWDTVRYLCLGLERAGVTRAVPS